ncbi:MAG: hypothetical protein II951_03830 [Bacteroidales bacterium]|nr:hypothetical protein [Bacteroidales bacterium]
MIQRLAGLLVALMALVAVSVEAYGYSITTKTSDVSVSPTTANAGQTITITYTQPTGTQSSVSGQSVTYKTAVFARYNPQTVGTGTKYQYAKLTETENTTKFITYTFTMPAYDVEVAYEHSLPSDLWIRVKDAEGNDISACFTVTGQDAYGEETTGTCVIYGNVTVKSKTGCNLTGVSSIKYNSSTGSGTPSYQQLTEYTCDNGQCTFIMPKNSVTIVASYERMFTVTTEEPEEGGTVTLNGGKEYTAGETVTVTAEAGEWYEFDRLIVNGEEQAEGVKTFTMPAKDVTLGARFKRQKFNVTVASGIEHGTLTPEVTSSEWGKQVLVRDEVEDGYELVHLIVNGVACGQGVASFEMPKEDVVVGALIQLKEFTVTADDNVEELSSTKGTKGQTITFKVKEKDGYRPKVEVRDFTGRELDKSNEGGTYSFTMPTRPVTIEVSYDAIQMFTVDANQTKFEYNGKEQGPTLTVKDANSGEVLDNETHYILSEVAKTDAGTYTATVTGKTGTDYEGCVKTVTWMIDQATATVTVGSPENVSYNGEEQKQEDKTTVTVTALSRTLVEGTDYEVNRIYAGDYTNAGTKTVSIEVTSKNPNIKMGTESVQKTYVIEQAELSKDNDDFEFSLSETEVEYDTYAHTPTVTAKFKKKDLDRSQEIMVSGDVTKSDPGEYEITIAARDKSGNNFKGSVKLTWEITATEYTIDEANEVYMLNKTTAILEDRVEFRVTGKDGYKTIVKVLTTKGEEVYVELEDEVYSFYMPASNVTIYVSYVSSQFTVKADKTKFGYNGKEQGPTLTVSDVFDADDILTEVEDYTVSDAKKTDAGKYTATVTGKEGTYYEDWEKTIEWEIEAAMATVTIGSPENVSYNGEEQKQEDKTTVTVTGVDGNLVEGTDYEVNRTYTGDYTNAGEKTVIVEVAAKNQNYTLNIEREAKTYTIEQAELSTESSDFEISLSEAEVKYDMEEHEQTVTAKFKGRDLTANDVTIEGDLKATEPGTHKITLTGKGNFTGSVELTWEIKATEYTVTIPAATECGSVSANKEKAILGEEVTLTVAEETGYRLTTLAASYGDGIEIDITEDGKFLMPEGDVTVRVEFEKETYPITVTYDEEFGDVSCPTEKMWGETVEVSAEAKEGYEIAHIYISIDGKMIEEGVTSFEMPMDKQVVVMVVFRKELKAAVPVEDKETGEVSVVAETTEALAEIIGAVNDRENDYYEGASIVLTSDIDGGEEGKQEIDLEEQNHETMTEKAIELPTIETLKGSIEGQGNVIKNVIAQMTGLVNTVEEKAEVNTLVMDSTTIYIDPTDEAWTVKDDTIFVHIVAKSNKGSISNFAFAGKVVVDEVKVPEGKTVVICVVGENEGSVNGFYYDFDLLAGNVDGNKRCITIKQNIGCAKNGGRAKVATSKAADNKTLNVGTYDEAEVNKMERAFTAREFASGEVAYWLNWSEQGYTGEYRPIWRQGKNYPELAIDIDGEMNALYKIDYVVNEPEKITENPVFANNGDKVTIRYSEKPVSIKNGDEEVEVGDESTTIVFHANKSIEIEFAETTGKKEKVVTEEVDTWHDLAGRKLTGKPGRNGVYVHNGKIEMVK